MAARHRLEFSSKSAVSLSERYAVLDLIAPAAGSRSRPRPESWSLSYCYAPECFSIGELDATRTPICCVPTSQLCRRGDTATTDLLRSGPTVRRDGLRAFELLESERPLVIAADHCRTSYDEDNARPRCHEQVDDLYVRPASRQLRRTPDTGTRYQSLDGPCLDS